VNTKWDIVFMDRNVITGFVTAVAWEAVSKQGQEEVHSVGRIDYVEGVIDDDFIPFEDIKEKDVIDWVKSQVDEDAILADHQARLDAALAPSHARKEKKDLPWNNRP